MRYSRLRRLLRFRLRTVLGVITLLCILLGTVVWRAEQQKAAVAWLNERPAVVRYDTEGRKSLLRPDWLCKLIGIDYFASVVFVCLQSDDPGDLQPLASLTKLEDLRFSIESSETVDLSLLAKLTHLKRLWANCRTADLSSLASLAELEDLTFFTDSGETVDLSPLARLTNLRSLDLTDARVQDISPLEGLRNLEDLSLCATDVSDLTPLAKLSALRDLDLHGTLMCDLSPLATLNLKDLAVDGSLVSDDQIAELNKLLPNCRIRTE